MKEDLIVRIKCGEEVGTAFYVAPDLLLTAHHVIAFRQQSDTITIFNHKEGKLECKVLEENVDYDLALLQVPGRASKDYIPLLSHQLRIGETFVSYGYPSVEEKDGLRINAGISQKVTDSTGDYQMLAHNVDDAYDYQGMSGAPVEQDGKCIAVVIEQSGNKLNIISVSKFAEFLTGKVDVEEDKNLTSIPKALAENVCKVYPNYAVYNSLEDILDVQSSAWILLHGTPGSGKTFVSADFNPQSKQIKVLSRFFFKVPGDLVSRAERCSVEYFANWLESVYISETKTDLVKLSFEEKKGKIGQWLMAINDVLIKEGKYGVLFIDGLDELVSGAKNDTESFLSLIPVDLPSNIKVVLSCIKEDILPPFITEKISEESKIEVTPLDPAACELYIKNNTGKWQKPYSFVQAVAQKTEGHPLYMNYLCRYISDKFNEKTTETELNDWIKSLPSIGGDIRSYYNAIWQRFQPDGCTIEILALLSQVRGSIDEQQLIAMMHDHDSYKFASSITEFKHLLKEQDTTKKYEIYHSSFSLYITNRLGLTIVKHTNDQIAQYCEANVDSTYSRENYLHHLVNSSQTQRGLTLCDQEWADNCAKHDVSPDIVMHDIKECLGIAVDKDLPITVIRLMLLAQRMENRNDSIMVNDVDKFVDINIAFEKPDVAIKYIVRDNILLIDLLQALKYLVIFYELGYNEQALQLSGSIDAVIRREFDEKSKEGISSMFLVARGVLIITDYYYNHGDSHQVEMLYKFLHDLKQNVDEKSFQGLKIASDATVAYQVSTRLRLGIKVDFESHLEALKTGWSKDIVLLGIRSLLIYDDNDCVLNKKGHNEAYINCLGQIEQALSCYVFDFTREEMGNILAVLAEDSKRFDIVEKLIKAYSPQTSPLNFRKANGVDIDNDALQKYYLENLFACYADHSEKYPDLNRDYSEGKNWEGYISSLIKAVAFVTGQIYRDYAMGKDVEKHYSYIKRIISCIDFTLADRVKWKRSYLLPEDLLPFIYDRLMNLFCKFFPTHISDLIAHYKDRLDDQLGLYREGFCAILIRQLDILTEKQKAEYTSFFADTALKYIKYAVQNRSERCSYLLSICRDSAILHDMGKYYSAYQEVLNSSMGPEWYKEAQLDLINDFGAFDIHFDNKQIENFAAIFEEASGEMTFQRYVRQEKDHFVGTIAKVSSLSDAISYYKFETLPLTDTIIHNAEDWKVDMPQIGMGYDLGANHLIESSAICYLLRACPDVSPYIRYAISELFWDNWDKMHNDQNYAFLHADIISHMNMSAAKDDLIPRMTDYYVHQYKKANKNSSYLSDLDETNITESVLTEFQNRLNELGGNWIRKKREGNDEEHEEHLPQKLDNLTTSKDILILMRKDIVSPLGNYWYSLSQFIKPLVRKADSDKSELLNVIAKHFNTNVRPSETQLNKFKWFKGYHQEDDANKQMIHFLIWFLVHPDPVVSKRAESSLLWLVNYEPLVVKCLIDEIIDPSEIGLNRESSGVLLKITSLKPDFVVKYIKGKVVQEQLLKVESFSVSWNLYQISTILSRLSNFHDLQDAMDSIVPRALPDKGEVMIDFYDMDIERKIDLLNNLKVTGGKEFAMPFEDKMSKMMADGSLEKLMKADYYIKRSFYHSSNPKGRYNRHIVSFIDSLLYGKVDVRRGTSVYQVINS